MSTITIQSRIVLLLLFFFHRSRLKPIFEAFHFLVASTFKRDGISTIDIESTLDKFPFFLAGAEYFFAAKLQWQ